MASLWPMTQLDVTFHYLVSLFRFRSYMYGVMMTEMILGLDIWHCLCWLGIPFLDFYCPLWKFPPPPAHAYPRRHVFPIQPWLYWN